MPQSASTPTLRLPILALLIITCHLAQTRPLIAGSTIEIECPYSGLKQFASMRTFALVLNNAQKNMEVSTIRVAPNTPHLQKENTTTKNQIPSQGQLAPKSQQALTNLNPCILSRSNKICAYGNFTRYIHLQCASQGTVSMLVVQPYEVSSIDRDEPLREQTLALNLAENQTGVVVFKPDFGLGGHRVYEQQILISNCIEHVEYFQQELLIGVRRGRQTAVIMVAEGVTGQWFFIRSSEYLAELDHPVQAYSLANQEARHHIEEKLGAQPATYHGFKLLVRSENSTFIKQLGMEIRVNLSISDPLIVRQEQISRKIEIKAGDLVGNLPIKFSLFFEEHPISSIGLTFTAATHYVVQLSEARLAQRPSLLRPVIQEDEHLVYFYEQLAGPTIAVQAHIVKSYNNKATPQLRIYSEGVADISGSYSDEHAASGLDSKPAQPGKTIKNITIAEGRIEPLTISGNKPYAEISFSIRPPPQKKKDFAFFKLLLCTSTSPFQLTIGREVTEYLFENQLKRYVIPREKLEALQSKKLFIRCSECHIYSTYDPQCISINCCEEVISGYVDVRPLDLYLVVRASNSNKQETALIRLEAMQNEQGFLLVGGHIVEAVLRQSDTYIYEAEGKGDVEILCNSHSQSVLLLVGLSEFPSKNSFEYQSNEGYIRIPAPRARQTLYIRLLKMVTSSAPLSYYSYKVPYSLLVASTGDMITLRQGKPFSYTLSKNSSREYLAGLHCGKEDRYYVRVSTRGHAGTGMSNLAGNQSNKLKIEIGDKLSQSLKISKLVAEQITVDISRLITKSLEESHKNKTSSSQPQLCNVSLNLTNLLPNSALSSTVVFFRQNRGYRAQMGEFMHYHTLADDDLNLYCIVDPYRGSNVYAYSLNQQIRMHARMVAVSHMSAVDAVIGQFFGQDEGKQKEGTPGFKVLAETEEKVDSHSQYIYMGSAAEFFPRRQPNLTLLLVTIKKPAKQSPGFDKKDISVVCTHNETTVQVGNRLQYKLRHEQSHLFRLPLSKQLLGLPLGGAPNGSPNSRSALNEKELIMQTTKLDGNYTSSIGLRYMGEKIPDFDMDQQTDRQRYSSRRSKNVLAAEQEPVLIVKVEKLLLRLDRHIRQKNLGKPISELSFPNLYLQFKLTCHKSANQSCLFLSSVQSTQSTIRSLTPGIPEIFHMNKHSSIVFVYNNNIHDREFKFKVNRRLGLPKYKLCSYRPSSASKEDRCLSDLQTPLNEHLLIDQNEFNTDSNLIVGRTHELIINQYNEEYCTNCTYYLGLYSGYDVVEGSIFVMSANQPTYIEEGNSITTIVYRGEPDRYLLTDWASLMGLVYQIEGNVQVDVYTLGKEGQKEVILSKTSTTSASNQTQHGQPVPTKNLIPIQLNSSLVGIPHHISIQPAHNSPSALYTLIVVNRRQHIINIKDGVPYEMKYAIGDQEAQELNPIIHYLYRCESEAVVMIGTGNFEDIEVELRCEDYFIVAPQVGGQAQNQSQQVDAHVGGKQGRLIDITDVLKVRKAYRMSNRLDLNLNSKTCTRYRVTVTAKAPTAAYTILVSSTDIITLPLHKEVPGVLKYQTKLYQIYEISVHEKTEIRVTFKFCQGGDGRIMVSKSKKNIYMEIYEQEYEIQEETTYQTIRYMAKPGFFYIKVEFKGRGGRLEYTIHAESVSDPQPREGQTQSPNLRVYNQLDLISYRVQRVGYNFTEYEIEFYPIVQQPENLYEIQYFLVESTKLKLLKKTENCNGQYFVQFVNHHEQIRQTKINITREALEMYSRPQKTTKGQSQSTVSRPQYQQSEDPSQKPEDQQQLQSEPSLPPLKFTYSTPTPYTFITVIPIIFNRDTHEFYHLYVPKYREVQLKNGQLFASFAYILSEALSKIQTVVDIHGSQNVLLAAIGVLICACVIALVLGGIWIGSRFCFRTKTVYVLKEVRQDEHEDEDEDGEDNRMEESGAGMAEEGESRQAEKYIENEGQATIETGENLRTGELAEDKLGVLAEKNEQNEVRVETRDI